MSKTDERPERLKKALIKMKNVKKTKELFDNKDIVGLLNDQLRRVKWLYENSNKYTQVYDEKFVRLIISWKDEEIKDLKFQIKEYKKALKTDLFPCTKIE